MIQKYLQQKGSTFGEPKSHNKLKLLIQNRLNRTSLDEGKKKIKTEPDSLYENMASNLRILEGPPIKLLNENQEEKSDLLDIHVSKMMK